MPKRENLNAEMSCVADETGLAARWGPGTQYEAQLVPWHSNLDTDVKVNPSRSLDQHLGQVALIKDALVGEDVCSTNAGLCEFRIL